MFYVIDKKRLMNEYYNKLKKGIGCLNWFISPDKILNIIIDREGVKYLYREPMDSVDVDAMVKIIIDPRLSILGFVEERNTRYIPIENDIMYIPVGNIIEREKPKKTAQEMLDEIERRVRA